MEKELGALKAKGLIESGKLAQQACSITGSSEAHMVEYIVPIKLLTKSEHSGGGGKSSSSSSSSSKHCNSRSHSNSSSSNSSSSKIRTWRLQSRCGIDRRGKC